MLKALLNEEEIIAIDPKWSGKTEELRNLANRRAICPICFEPIICKFGEQKIHHFAHSSKSDCPNKSDTYEHIKGKTLLYGYFQNLLGKEAKVTIENYFKEGNILSDIFLEFITGEKIAVEFYSKHITAYEINRKINFFRDNNISIIWIISHTLLKVIKTNFIKLTSIENQFRTYNQTEKFYINDWYREIVVNRRIVEISKKILLSCVYYLDIESEILLTYKALKDTKHLRVYNSSKVYKRDLKEYKISKKGFLYLKEDEIAYGEFEQTKKILKELKKSKEENDKPIKSNNETFLISNKRDVYKEYYEKLEKEKFQKYTCEVCKNEFLEEDMPTYQANTRIGKCRACLKNQNN